MLVHTVAHGVYARLVYLVTQNASRREGDLVLRIGSGAYAHIIELCAAAVYEYLNVSAAETQEGVRVHVSSCLCFVTGCEISDGGTASAVGQMLAPCKIELTVLLDFNVKLKEARGLLAAIGYEVNTVKAARNVVVISALSPLKIAGERRILHKILGTYLSIE